MANTWKRFESLRIRDLEQRAEAHLKRAKATGNQRLWFRAAWLLEACASRGFGDVQTFRSVD